MRPTKRSQNKCGSCGYTWFPRGKNKSIKCPNCGANNVSFVGGGSLLVGILFVGWLVFGGNGKLPEAPKSSAAIPAAMEMASEPPKVDLVFPQEKLKTASAEKLTGEENPLVSSEEVSEHSGANDLSPVEICEREPNFFLRNNCMWRACEKPEFSELKVCESRRHKGPGSEQ